MYLMYVDESGDTGLVNSPTAYFVLSGIIVHESNWRQFLNHLVLLTDAAQEMDAEYDITVDMNSAWGFVT